MKQVTDKMLTHYFEVTGKALKIAKENITKDVKMRKQADDFIKMAQCYYDDALHFREKGNYVNAFGAIYYAHAWLDAGARIGFFEVHDSELFTAD